MSSESRVLRMKGLPTGPGIDSIRAPRACYVFGLQGGCINAFCFSGNQLLPGLETLVFILQWST